MALNITRSQNIPIEIVDPEPIATPPQNATIHKMKASTYLNKVEIGKLL